MAGLGLTQLTPRLGDVAPFVRAGGKAGELNGKSQASTGLSSNVVVATPRTPPDLGEVRSRHRQRTDTGQITKHWGMHDMKLPLPGLGYGVKSNKGDNVAQNFKAGQKLGVAEYRDSVGESVYKSTVQEPLGKSWVRGHKLPDYTKEAAFGGFGVKSALDEPAKESIWPRGYGPETGEAKKLYKKTHGSTEPGEMTSREYEWPKSVTGNPHFRFGAVDASAGPNNGQGAKSALTMDTGEKAHEVPNTRIVKNTVEHFREVASEKLGKSRSLLQGMPPLPIGHAFGKEGDHDSTTAGALIRGWYTDDEQAPDPDLGCSTARGRRNFVTQAPLGVPSIRVDLRAPPVEKRSISTSTNYGDDYDARGLIFPGKFHTQDVTDADFQTRRTKDDLRGICKGAGYSLDASDFDLVFEAAAALHGDGEDLVSAQAFMHAYSDWFAGSVTRR